VVAVKHQSADSFLAKMDRRITAVLTFGPDAGLVAERAARAAAAMSARETPAGEILRLDDSDLESDPDRLVVELMTMPMFGGTKVIRTVTGRRINAPALKALLAEPLQGCLVVEAGNLKKDDALRLAFEKSDRAAAIACYADEGATIDSLIAEVLSGHGLTVTSDAKAALQARLGADRALSRAELEKLALYVGEGEVTLDHIQAIVGDASELAIERITGAALTGRTADAVVELDRALAAGESPQAIIGALQRQLLRLHRSRAQMDDGRSLEETVRQQRPPLPFPAQRDMERQLRLWSTARLTAALERLGLYAAQSRLTGTRDDLLAERLVLEIATRASPGRRA